MTIEEVAKELNVSTRTIRNWEKDKKIQTIAHMLGMKYHRSDVNRLSKCINANVPILRRPINVNFDSMIKPPPIIDCVGMYEYKNEKNIDELECWRYVPIHNENRIKELERLSFKNGWTKDGYQNVELIDPNGFSHHTIFSNGVHCLLPIATSMFLSHKWKPHHLDKSRLIIGIENEEIEESTHVINACPPFIIFRYYDIHKNDVYDRRQFYEGYPNN